ncbi:MAG: conjugal transfer protein TraD [Chryseobacterium sp.]|nr:MAG: conjugal transfer protein TraD [Chryseobacterium sp.]
MEIVIVICLLVIIVLLLHDKVVIYKWSDQNKASEKVNPELPDIIGQPKPLPRLHEPIEAIESQVDVPFVDPHNLDIEYDENEIVRIQIPQEDLDEVFGTMPDFEEEEESWMRQGVEVDDFGFAQGVSFDELAKVGRILKEEKLEFNQKLEAVEIVQKLQGTELFYLLENSIEGASRKIAQLLDSSFNSSTDSTSSTMRSDDLSDFDIEEYI